MANQNIIMERKMKIRGYVGIILAMALGTLCSFADIYEPFELKSGEAVFNTSARYINVIDPTPVTNASGSAFPGGRGANQLVIYTPEFGDRTNTNEFGTEAVVQNNIVTLISGANSFIPEDGVVISGHGSAKVWITQNIGIGTKVYIDKENNTLNVYTTSDSYMYEAEEKIKETKDMIDFYRGRKSNYAWKEANDHIQCAITYLRRAKKDSDNQELVKRNSSLAILEANAAMETVLPSMTNEAKGVWIRPTQTSREQIISTLDNMKKTGIDNVFLETFYHGKTIFPSKTMHEYGFNVQNQQFAMFDPLKIWIDEAHKRNIKIHIWFQSFYVGNVPPSGKDILAIHNEWGNKIRQDYESKTPTRSKSEHNGYFLDPANPEVQDFLIKLVTEIVNTYRPDGINLDYIRYPQAVSKYEAGNWGYTEYARQDFKDMYGVDPVELSKNDVLWEDWDKYRREHITNFVRKAGAVGKQNSVYVSTVIFPDMENALSTKQQDWRTWSKRNYINGFTPLFLTYDPKMVASMINDVNSVKSSSTDLYAGLFVTFMGGTNEDLVRQIHEARKLNVNGIILFDYAHTTDTYASMLSKSAFKPVTIAIPAKTNSNNTKRFWIFKR